MALVKSTVPSKVPTSPNVYYVSAGNCSTQRYRRLARRAELEDIHQVLSATDTLVRLNTASGARYKPPVRIEYYLWSTRRFVLKIDKYPSYSPTIPKGINILVGDLESMKITALRLRLW